MAGIPVNRQALNRIQSLLNDPIYKEAIEHSASYNTRLCIDRKMRLPFLDAQTGVAQNNCYLWMHKRNRMPGERPGQLYTYPSKRWRKRRRQYLVNFLRPRVRDIEYHESGSMDGSGKLDDDDKVNEDSKDSWYRDYEDLVEPPDAGEIDDQESDFEDYEDTYAKRKKKKTTTPTRGKRRSMGFDPATEAEKPYQCDLCGARYKTRPGLSYHYSHSHQNSTDTADDENTAPSPPKPSTSTVVPSATTAAAAAANDPLAGLKKFQDSFLSFLKDPESPTAKAGKPVAGAPAAGGIATATTATVPVGAVPPGPTAPAAIPATPPNAGSVSPVPPQAVVAADAGTPVPSKPACNPSPYCDFCLGDANENKKTKQAEELVSCSDCGRSGHPTCLQFTQNMMISVKKYRWQCIECKCCTLCGTSDNDDQLLFCDDCDRGYHMYCLDPPLQEPPEGSWSCHLCIEEFHKK